jgi:hypothetical protein
MTKIRTRPDESGYKVEASVPHTWAREEFKDILEKYPIELRTIVEGYCTFNIPGHPDFQKNFLKIVCACTVKESQEVQDIEEEIKKLTKRRNYIAMETWKNEKCGSD